MLNAIVKLHKKGEGYKQNAKKLYLSKNSVAKVVQRFKKTGQAAAISQRPGRPRKISQRAARFLVRKVQKNPRTSATELAETISEDTGVVVSAQTVRRTLQETACMVADHAARLCFNHDIKVLD